MLSSSFAPHFVWRPEQSAPTSGSPLSGMRLAVKDLFDIKGMVTGCGNPRWASTHQAAHHTSEALELLLSAGAHIVGKTLTDELAYSLNGVNKHFGTPLNPAAPERIPGGSSSGSAVAVKLEQADIGLGTDTGGSIRVPAAYNGLVGLRPTHKAISTKHMVGLAPGFDTVGWMTRDLCTLSQVAKVMLPPSSPKPIGQLTFMHALFERSSYANQALESVRLSGIPFVDEANWPVSFALSELSLAFRILQGAEILETHGAWLAAHADSLAEDIQIRVAWCRDLTRHQIEQANQIRCEFRDQINRFLNGDIWIMPTTPGPAPKLDASADFLAGYRETLMGFTSLAGLAGLPQLHLPLLTVDGAPCGISLLAAQFMEGQLIEVAQALTESLKE